MLHGLRTPPRPRFWRQGKASNLSKLSIWQYWIILSQDWIFIHCMSYTEKPCGSRKVQVFAPRPDWSTTLGWRTCKQNATPIRIFGCSYQKVVACEGSHVCQRLEDLQLVCFISSHSFHSTVSGTHGSSALGIQGFQSKALGTSLNPLKGSSFFSPEICIHVRSCLFNSNWECWKKSMVWWYGMENPRKRLHCMEHLRLKAYIHIWSLLSSFPSFPPSKSSVPSKKLVKPAMIPAKAVGFGFGALRCKCFTFMEADGKQKVPPVESFGILVFHSSLAKTKDVVGVPSYLCLAKPSFLQRKKNMWYWYNILIHTWFCIRKTHSKIQFQIHLSSPDVYLFL